MGIIGVLYLGRDGLLFTPRKRSWKPGQPIEMAPLELLRIALVPPPPRNAILLAGDSQFHRWKTVATDLPGYTVINRGIDSFQTSDSAGEAKSCSH